MHEDVRDQVVMTLEKVRVVHERGSAACRRADLLCRSAAALLVEAHLVCPGARPAPR